MSIPKRRLARLIYLTGARGVPGYTVETSCFDGLHPFGVTSALVGNAIVRALREIAATRPDYFPPSKLESSR